MCLFKNFLLTAFLFSATTSFAQSEISKDAGGQKIIKGFLTKDALAADSAFGWFAANQKGYTPYPAALKSLSAQKDSVYFLVFAGTWCHDTQFILPKFFSLASAAGIAPNHITTIGVDEAKKSQYGLTELFRIENVPTIILLKNGKEAGRVVEYGSTGMFDKELGEIASGKR